MQTRNFLLLISIILLLMPNLAAQVTDTFNGAAFDYRITPGEKNSDYQLFHLEFPSPLPSQVPENNTVYAEYYLPVDYNGEQIRYPVVICLHILDGNLDLTRLFCMTFAKSGIAAIMPPLPFYGKRRPADWQRWEKMLASSAEGPDLFFSSTEQGILDIRRTVDFLISRPEICRDKIGIMGISLGGITAALVMEKEKRIDKGALLLAGGDLATIMNASHEAEFLRKLADNYKQGREAFMERLKTIDPLTDAASLRERGASGRIIVCYAEQDEVIPSSCTLRLASDAGIPEENLYCIPDVGHYTAASELPRILELCTEFFGGKVHEDRDAEPTKEAEKLPRYVATMQHIGSLLKSKIPDGKGVQVQIEFEYRDKGKNIRGKLDLILGSGHRFKLGLEIPGICGKFSLGNADYPWLISVDGTAFVGTLEPCAGTDFTNYLIPKIAFFRKIVVATCNIIAIYPGIVERLVSIEEAKERPEGKICYHIRDKKGMEAQLVINEKDATVGQIKITQKSSECIINIGKFMQNADFPDSAFAPSGFINRMEVEQKRLHRIFAAVANHLAELASGSHGQRENEPIRESANGHGMLSKKDGKLVLFVEGTPQEMGMAHGELFKKEISYLQEKTIYLYGGIYTALKNRWFFERIKTVEESSRRFIPERFLLECDAMAESSGTQISECRAANLFPEMFHCSGVAVRGKATLDGRVLHARVLDYMTEIGLQKASVVTVFMPKDKNAWLSVSYTGFIGTVTAMNEKGLAIGEMGGRGDEQWNGCPMSFLLRDIMERAESVEEALQILQNTPRTCEYYYVLSDKKKNMAAVHATGSVLECLHPGQQHPALPHVPDDAVFISGGNRAKLLSERLVEYYGKITPEIMIELIKHPVAMKSNLHNAVFAPETLDLWFANASPKKPAYDMPYTHMNLAELKRFYFDKRSKK